MEVSFALDISFIEEIFYKIRKYFLYRRNFFQKVEILLLWRKFSENIRITTKNGGNFTTIFRKKCVKTPNSIKMCNFVGKIVVMLPLK